VNDHFFDFQDDPELLASLQEFLNNTVKPVIGGATIEALEAKITRKVS
jgi:hypothetical protein